MQVQSLALAQTFWVILDKSSHLSSLGPLRQGLATFCLCRLFSVIWTQPQATSLCSLPLPPQAASCLGLLTLATDLLPSAARLSMVMVEKQALHQRKLCGGDGWHSVALCHQSPMSDWIFADWIGFSCLKTKKLYT